MRNRNRYEPDDDEIPLSASATQQLAFGVHIPHAVTTPSTLKLTARRI